MRAGVSGRGHQKIVKYQKRWPADFKRIAAELRSVLPAAVEIEHYGSTSVPGLASRSIIDIQVAVPDIAARNVWEPALTRLGYRPFAPPDLKPLVDDGMLIYVPADDSNTVHLAVCQQGGEHISRHLAVRDYLRTHSDEAAAYEEIKRRAADSADGVRETYARAKADFVVALERRALRWAAQKID